MHKIALFPGVDRVPEIDAVEPDLDAILERQSDLLARWQEFGRELKRRSEHPLPLGLEIELGDLIDETNA
jgi:hypothetical protein